jgi:tetratricopeptide (TPR) repeat protein
MASAIRDSLGGDLVWHRSELLSETHTSRRQNTPIFPSFADALGRKRRGSCAWTHLEAALAVLPYAELQLARRDRGNAGPRTLDRLRGLVGHVKRSAMRQCLTRIVDAIATRSGRRFLRMVLVAYADRLQESGSFALAIDVHRCIIRQSRRRAGFNFGAASRRLGFCLRQSGRLSEALLVYEEGIEWSRRHDDPRALVHLIIAQANAYRVMGRVADARGLLHTALQQAITLGNPELILRAAHEGGIVAIEQGRYVVALTQFGVALDALGEWKSKSARSRLLNDVGFALQHIGLHDIARKVFFSVHLTAPEPTTRWEATINLLGLAVADGHEDSFHHFRRALGTTALPAQLLEAYWADVGKGYIRFGEPEVGRGYLVSALRIAAEYDLKDRLREVYLTLMGLPSSEPEMPIDPANLSPTIQRLIDRVEQVSESPPVKRRSTSRGGRPMGATGT